LGQIQRELFVTNAQDSEQLSNQVSKFSTTHEKYLTVQAKKRRLQELTQLIDNEEKLLKESMCISSG
jgi:NAD-dependent SIR2 family protein deacetylase